MENKEDKVKTLKQPFGIGDTITNGRLSGIVYGPLASSFSTILNTSDNFIEIRMLNDKSKLLKIYFRFKNAQEYRDIRDKGLSIDRWRHLR